MQVEPHLFDESKERTRLWIITLQDGIEVKIALWKTMHDSPDTPYKPACHNKSPNYAKTKLTILDHHCFYVE